MPYYMISPLNKPSGQTPALPPQNTHHCGSLQPRLPKLLRLTIDLDLHRLSRKDDTNHADPIPSTVRQPTTTTQVSRDSLHYLSRRHIHDTRCRLQVRQVGKYSRVHTTPLDHHVPGPRNGLLRFFVRALAVDDVKRRGWRHDRELAAEDDHVVCRGRPVLWDVISRQPCRFSSPFLCANSLGGGGVEYVPSGCQSAARGRGSRCSCRRAGRCPTRARCLAEAGRWWNVLFSMPMLHGLHLTRRGEIETYASAFEVGMAA